MSVPSKSYIAILTFFVDDEAPLSSTIEANGSRCRKCSTVGGASILTVDRWDGGKRASSFRAATLEKNGWGLAAESKLQYRLL